MGGKRNLVLQCSLHNCLNKYFTTSKQLAHTNDHIVCLVISGLKTPGITQNENGLALKEIDVRCGIL